MTLTVWLLDGVRAVVLNIHIHATSRFSQELVVGRDGVTGSVLFVLRIDDAIDRNGLRPLACASSHVNLLRRQILRV